MRSPPPACFREGAIRAGCGRDEEFSKGDWRTVLDSLPVDIAKHPDESNLRRKGLVYLTVPNIAHHSRKIGKQELEAAGHMASMTRKQKDDYKLALSSLLHLTQSGIPLPKDSPIHLSIKMTPHRHAQRPISQVTQLVSS